VVASDVGGLQFTVVPEQTGLLAPPKDESLAAAIDRILSDPVYRNNLAKAAESGWKPSSVGKVSLPTKRTIHRAFGATS